jgi:hypothetical protein
MYRSNKIAVIYFMVISLLLSSISRAQPVTIDASLDTNRILIGDQVRMSIEVIKPANSVIIFPKFGNTLTDEIEIIEKTGIDSSELENDRISLLQEVTLTAFDSGLLYIPRMDFIYRSEGYTDTLSSSANYLEVIPVKIDTTGTIRDIKGLYKSPYSFGELLPFILILLFAGLLIWFINYYLKKKKKDEPILRKPKSPEPAHIIAIRELDKLKAEKLWQQNKVKLFYTRLTIIIRTYIERRFYIRAMEQTTTEILEEFQGRNIQNVDYEILEQLLNLADLVKFARSQPLPDENMTHMDNAYAFVKNTKQQPVDGDIAYDDVNTANIKELSA